MTILEMLTIALCLVGVTFLLLASIGVLRLPDLYTRIHAAGKSGSLGIIGVLLGAGIYHGDLLTTLKMMALIGFFLITAPVASHMLDQSAYITGVKTDPSTVMDDLAGHYDKETGHLS